jgi:hypothetical protein
MIRIQVEGSEGWLLRVADHNPKIDCQSHARSTRHFPRLSI